MYMYVYKRDQTQTLSALIESVENLTFLEEKVPEPNPGIMKLLVLCLVAALVATAHSLTCQCTEGPGCTSEGICTVPDFGTCMMMAQENNLGGARTSGIYKACQWDDQACDEKVMTIMAGKGMYWMSNTECCATNSCNTAFINVPPVSHTPNGLKCPACFAFGSDCEADETLTCTGTQDHCIAISGMVNGESGLSSPFVAKGCSTGTACSLPLGVDLYSAGVAFYFNRITCNPPPSLSSRQ